MKITWSTSNAYDLVQIDPEGNANVAAVTLNATHEVIADVMGFLGDPENWHGDVCGNTDISNMTLVISRDMDTGAVIDLNATVLAERLGYWFSRRYP